MILIPVPSSDFDPSEASLPWKLLSESNFKFQFATPDGKKAKADERMLTGKGLGILKSGFMARKDARDAYFKMENSKEFQNPIPYSEIKEKDFQAILLPGGHAQGMKEYLESRILQNVVVDFFQSNKPVAAICHGVLLAARSINPKTNKSVLYEKNTTALLQKQELLAYYTTRLWLGNYYKTYPLTVQEEVTGFLKSKGQFKTGGSLSVRDSLDNPDVGFTVLDGNYLSARWPGDAYQFASAFKTLL
ncbi:type 1 glutamine amidotransferase domain-containing protein [Leptospira mtsangambouensis]|uniref:type 1 glutamine amidotransferase domain-containing protein n=1 Tax=Leptospira mtsangambouensis TaxID=2484912 RepID=UPI001EEC7343|nr:type 1 glutamine amidotransferase domain-containing protein [Leptospira mtsangambouensis]MCG6139162.1 type 1 glutamine amidotransferase domain-containing protein [Leptospira mtsangambouensis]